MLEEFGEVVSNKVSDNLGGVSPTQKEIICYTIVQFLGEFIKIVIMAAIAIYFKVGTLLLIAIFSMAIYRIPSGGVHSKKHISCFVTSFILFFGNIIISSNLKGEFLDYIYFAIFIFNLIVIYFMAPADTEMKPIVSKKLRKRLKLMSYLAMIVTIVIGRFIIADLVIRNIFIVGTFIQSVTMLPFFYKILSTKYGFRDGIYEPQI